MRRFEGSKGVLHGAVRRKSIQTEATDGRMALRQEPVGAFGTANALQLEQSGQEGTRGEAVKSNVWNRASHDF